MQSALISIMMPAYNAENYVAQAIESVLAQSYGKWQLVIVDDGSTDNTGIVAAKFQDSRILIAHQPNAGEAAARNAALKYAGGDYLAFLDADDLFLPQHLECCLTHLESHPDCDGVYTDGIYIDENGVSLKPLSCRRRGPFRGDIFEEMVRASDVFGAPLCVVLRTKGISDRKLDFDTEIVIGPDWDFLTRFSESARFGYLDQKTCLYRIHSSNVSLRTNQRKRLQSLARCREKSIKLKRFGSCSIQTRAFVFYDLLVNLLTHNPKGQMEIAKWPEFLDLPAAERARLFRLMAGQALLNGLDHGIIQDWLRASRQLNPADKQSYLLNALFCLHPYLCKILLRLKASSNPKAANASPFADLA
jgi:glycosyltransferase involved in cell wall biosynthesis